MAKCVNGYSKKAEFGRVHTFLAALALLLVSCSAESPKTESVVVEEDVSGASEAVNEEMDEVSIPFEEQFDTLLSIVEEIDPDVEYYRDTRDDFIAAFWEDTVDIERSAIDIGDVLVSVLYAMAGDLKADVNGKLNELRSLSLSGERKADLEELRTSALDHYYAWLDYSQEYAGEISDWITSWQGGYGYPFIAALDSLGVFVADINDTHRAFCGGLGASQPAGPGSSDYSLRIASLCAS